MYCHVLPLFSMQESQLEILGIVQQQQKKEFTSGGVVFYSTIIKLA